MSMLWEFSHKRNGVPLQATVETFSRNKILRSANVKYHFIFTFFYKMNKGSLIFDVFLCFEESEGGHTITAKKID